MLSRDSCLQLDTRNLDGTSENVFEDPSGNARTLTNTHYEFLSLNTGRSVAQVEEFERHTGHFASRTPRCARKFSTWNPSSRVEEAYPQNCMVDQSRHQVSEMHFDKFPYFLTFQ